MNTPRITLLGSHDRCLRDFFSAHAAGHERAAAVLFRRLHCHVPDLPDSDRYIAVDVVPFDESWITESSPSSVKFKVACLRELFRRCEEENLVFGFVHNHPTGPATFSQTDDENEFTLLKALSNRNGIDIHFVAMLWANDAWHARVRHGVSPAIAVTARHILVIGQKLSLYGYSTIENGDEQLHARQAAAFGQPFVDMIRSLRIAVIGGGGTGSATVTLLARSGAGELIVIDKDRLEKSNLNRVRGAGMRDVKKNKARILKEFVEYLELPVSVAAIEASIDDDPYALDALASCDVIFGCTDDQIGREVLNTALYVYAQAYIDIGLGGKVSNDKNDQPCLRYHFARISTLLPEYGECLFCQDVIRDDWIQHQYALRSNPAMSEQEARERYLVDGGEHAPGVGPFTSAAADYGVANLFDLLRPYRRYPPQIRNDMYVIDFVTMEFSSRQKKNDLNCPYCKKREYLLMKEKCRLNRPALGKPNVTI